MRLPVWMEKYQAIWRQHANVIVPVLRTRKDVQNRFGNIGYPKRYPGLTDAVRDTAEDQARQVRLGADRPEVGKRLYWVESQPLKIDPIYEDGSDVIKGWRVSVIGKAMWLAPEEVEFYRGPP